MFMLEMKVQGFFTKDFSGKKVYRKGVVINWEVELGAITVDMLMKVLAAELKWAPNQSAKLWFFDRNFGEDVRLVDDNHLIQMFQMYKSEMFCQILVEVFDISVRTEDEYDLLEPICAITPDGNPFLNNYPPTTYEPTNELTEQPTDFPYANLDSNTQPRTNDASQEPNIEPDREPDIFDNQEEYVGVDDERFYMDVPPTQSTTTHTAQQQPIDESSDPVATEGGIPLEGEVNDADPQELNVLHDPENPNIVKGALFSDIIAFRKAVRHYAVKRGFEFTGMQTDKTRFIAKCKSEGCPWRIRASRVFDGKTIQVIFMYLVVNILTMYLSAVHVTHVF
jgi:hypothetical protein